MLAVGARQDERELVAAVAAEHVGTPQLACATPAATSTSRSSPADVPAGVVVALEVVQVDEPDDDVLVTAHRGRGHLRRHEVEPATVERAGEAVEEREATQWSASDDTSSVTPVITAIASRRDDAAAQVRVDAP